jgi:hypothetical protein
MGVKSPTKLAFYCEPCELQFSVDAQQVSEPGKVFSVGCPWCKRKARVGRMPDGRFRIEHNRHVFTCPKPLNHNPLLVVIVYLGGLAVLSLAFAAAARMVEPYLCPIVLITAFLSIGIIGAIQLAIAGGLNKSYLESMRIVYKGLPILLGKKRPQGTIEPDNEPIEPEVASTEK